MFKTGFDSAVLAKDISLSLDDSIEKTSVQQPTENKQPPENVIETKFATPSNILKALIGCSVTTQDADFDQHYQSVLENVLKKHKIRQQKPLYKGAHLVKQVGEDLDKVFTDVLNGIAPAISHIDLYFATYPKPWVSIFGKGQGQRLTPLQYIEKHQNGFAHACAWWHWLQYSKAEPEYDYHIDHFESKATPAWAEMMSNGVNLKVYYSGCECDCLISFADLILKMIEEYHFGTIDYRSLPQPILSRCQTYATNKKVRFAQDLSKYDWVIQATVPNSYLEINLTNYIKHPIYFIAWTPTLPRDKVKRSFEWSTLYNQIIKKAIESKGCVKFLDFDNDMTLWDSSDYIIPWENADEEHVKLLQSMRFENMPKILKASSFTS
jgi:hypothetical protein